MLRNLQLVYLNYIHPQTSTPPSSPPPVPTLQKSTRANLCQRTEHMFQHGVLNTSLQTSSWFHQHQTLACHAALHTDYYTGLFNSTDTRDNATSRKNYIAQTSPILKKPYMGMLQITVLRVKSFTQQYVYKRPVETPSL